MNEINDVPQTVTQAGLDFNYSVWTPGSEVTLCNVPWNTDYRDVVGFDDDTALNSYIDSLETSGIKITQMSYLRPGRPIRLAMPIHRVQRYNYIRVYNPAQPVPRGDTPRYYYYFITGVNHVSPNTTEVMLQLDVWQTNIRQIEFGRCYIERGHIGIANENNFDNYGRTYLTVPEGLDLGGDYQIRSKPSVTIATTDTFRIMVISSTDLSVAGTIQNPELVTATGNNMENLPNGANIYIFPGASNFVSFMDRNRDKPWITQGIMSVTAIPDPDRYEMDSEFLPTIGAYKPLPGTLKRKRYSFHDDAGTGNPNLREVMENNVPARYRHLKKFLTYPYYLLELTMYSGTPLVLRPELWNSELGSVIEAPHLAPPGQRIVIYPHQYNSQFPSTDVVSDHFDDGGEFLDYATMINNFPQFSVVNNSYMSYLASNQAGIAYQHQSNDWSQNRALTAASTTFDQASAGMSLANEMTAIGINAAGAQNDLNNQMAGIDALKNVGQGVIGGAMVGGVAGAVGGGVGSAIGSAIGYGTTLHRNNAALAIQNSAARQQNSAQVNNMGYIRDTNKEYADWAARGDYADTIAGINSKIQDAKMIQPTTAGQIGGDAFLLAAYRWGYTLVHKTLDAATYRTIGDFWLRYGYAIQRFGSLPADLHVMSKFTYWKLKEVYILSAPMQESWKQAIRGILEKGVTVWRNPADIGRIDLANNQPLSGITL